MESQAFKLGVQIAKMGYSIYFNPFRYKGTAQQFLDWESGYKSVKENKGVSNG